MRAERSLATLALAVFVCAAAPAAGRTWHAAPGQAPAALAAATAGDTVVLGAGIHRGALRLARALVLRGEPGALVDGGGTGSVVRVAAAGARIEDLTITGSGDDVMQIDAGVKLETAHGVTLQRLVLRDVRYGIDAERSNDLRVRDCTLTGRVDRRREGEDGSGNGIHLWYSAGADVRDCDVSRFVDAIYLSFAQGTHLTRALLHDCGRYGLHTMYCQDGRITDSRFTHNQAGCAIMFSNHLEVTGSAFVENQGSRTYGLLLRDCSDGTFAGNRIVANTIGVFLDGSNRNRFIGDLVQDNGWGVLLYASCSDCVFSGNAFVHDDYPVALDMRRTDNRFDDGTTGNYWSDATAYDLDGDGLGDQEYAPVSAFAYLSKQFPDLTVLAKSPAVAALGVAEQVFPALRPSEAVDRHPLTSPPRLAPDRTPQLRTTARGAARARSWRGVGGFAALVACACAAWPRQGRAA